ncbi:hypothetical protein [Actinoplanes sp. M2I2]|uniref:hypothetical protein n=1 Tax=Actinoplanes sp. M2I2 TaxID=1734444 RepID=UPI0020209D47|nr:hypothetical protein [Actinoplanes sp. M2I2]
MRVRVWVVAVLTAGSLAGCAGVEPEPAAAPTSAAPAESHPSSAFLEPGWHISEDTLQAYQEALAKIDERLPTDENVAHHALEICHAIRQGETDAQLVNYAATQFKVEAAAAAKIVEATRSTVCPQ